jgi:hypothetical protein
MHDRKRSAFGKPSLQLLDPGTARVEIPAVKEWTYAALAQRVRELFNRVSVAPIV